VVIVFLINAATALASIVATVLALRVVVDSEHRVRTDKIDDRKATIWRAKDRAVGSVVDRAKVVGGAVWRRLARRSEGGRCEWWRCAARVRIRGDATQVGILHAHVPAIALTVGSE
jgi:hypothetical protein